MTEALQDGLDRLKQRSEDLKVCHRTAKKREVCPAAEETQSQALENQLRRVSSRLSSSGTQAPHPPPYRPRQPHGKGGPLLPTCSRKLDARPSIGTRTGHCSASLSKSPAGSDRTAPPPSATLEGWRPARLPNGSWGSLYAGPNPEGLPQNLVGLTISVQTRSGDSWDATVTEVVERTPARILVRTQRLGQ